jgi:hypothetical protein
VQLKKGTRRLQLKNAMRAKFDKIMLPIAEELIVEDQRQHVKHFRVGNRRMDWPVSTWLRLPAAALELKALATNNANRF